MVEFVIGGLLGFFLGMLLGAGATSAAMVLSPKLVPTIRRLLNIELSVPALQAPLEEMEELRRTEPAIARILEQPPAVNPVDVPAVVSASAVESGQLPPMKEPQLERFLRGLRGWRPRSAKYGDEEGFGNSMIWHLQQRAGLTRPEFEPKRRLLLQLGGETKPAIPDFIFWGRLLVEIKGDVFSASTADRALGQMFRYMLEWRTKGPGVLVICGYCSPLYRVVIRQYVATWRERFGMPITVFFASHESATGVEAVMPAG